MENYRTFEATFPSTGTTGNKAENELLPCTFSQNRVHVEYSMFRSDFLLSPKTVDESGYGIDGSFFR
jgi:hypothetical protein